MREKDNPLADLFASQFSPGAGLYLGLIGALAVAGALGFIAVRRHLGVASIKPYFVTQGISLAGGILLGVLLSPAGGSKRDTPEPGAAGAFRPFSNPRKSVDRAAAQSEWRKTHDVSEKEWDEMIAAYRARKRPKSVSEVDWWEEAKDKTPTDLNKLYPPLQPREWYQARWPESYASSRELDFSFTSREKKLKVTVMIETERNVPIKELHGHLAIFRGEEALYETELAETSDVSFTDDHFAFLRIPYDDSNPKHRTLRFAKDRELTPVFTVRKVVYADGTVKAFD